MTNQGDRHAAFRAISGTVGTYNGDSYAAFIAGGATDATYNGAFIQWLQIVTPSTNTVLSDLKNEFAISQGADSWNGLGTFSVSTFLPTDLANLSLWLDAADTDTITTGTGDNVTQWDDKSTNSNDALQGTESLQPATGVETINGLNVINFDIDVLSIVDSASVSFTGDCSFFAVLEIQSTGINQNYLSKGGPSAGNVNGAYRLRIDETIDAPWILLSDGGGLDTAVATSGISVNTPVVVSTLVDIGTDVSFFIDSTAVGTPSTTEASIADVSFPLNIGTANSNGDNEPFDGNIAELIAYDRLLTPSERLQVETYLADKWIPTAPSKLLLENGTDALLLENGTDAILLE